MLSGDRVNWGYDMFVSRKTLFLVVALPLAASFPVYGAEELRPNLIALPADDIKLVESFYGKVELRFATTSWNAGNGPLQIRAGETGQDRNGSYRQNVYQDIFYDDGSTSQRLMGTFVWHPAHNHFHVEGYAVYGLQKDGSKGKSKRTSEKTSFCLMDTDLVDGSLPGSPGAATYATCGNEIQGISVGWGDKYRSHLAGQEIDVSELANGLYRLTLEIDPKNRIVETNEDDNSSCVLLDINVSAMTVAVVDPTGCDAGEPNPPPGDNVVIYTITPNWGNRGTFVDVEIEGTGFTPNSRISFENGSGQSPSVSDFEFVNENMLRAIVTIKKGGPTSDMVWDVRVDSAVLSDAFTVYR